MSGEEHAFCGSESILAHQTETLGGNVKGIK
jgi:hypothetical protein